MLTANDIRIHRSTQSLNSVWTEVARALPQRSIAHEDSIPKELNMKDDKEAISSRYLEDGASDFCNPFSMWKGNNPVSRMEIASKRKAV